MSRLRVLVADDDTTCRIVLQATVEKLGHECIVWTHGAATRGASSSANTPTCW